MAKTTKQKTIHYKSSFITGNLNLQTLLEKAIGENGTAKKPVDRMQNIDEDEKSSIFINRYINQNGVSFGQLVYLESGKNQPYITIDNNQDFYSIEALSSEKIPDGESADKESKEDKIKRKREFLDSILYFCILDNHVTIIQSKALSSREFEAHLTWLFGSTCTSVFSTTTMLVLRDKPAESVFKKLEQSPAKSIQIGAPLTSITEDNTISSTNTFNQETHANKVKFTPTGKAASIIESLIPGFMSEIKLDDTLDDSNIHVALEITYKYKTDKSGQKVIDSIATSMRHSPESDVKILLKGGGEIKGDELKLSGKINAKFSDKGLIDESMLIHEMRSWLISKIGSKELEAGDETL
ncbi:MULTISPECIES: hypothetical protein [Cobetia]|uniref:hypothetical protein n=1 Tax=Cobetia TaxID=204286 RepID=UPI0032969BE5